MRADLADVLEIEALSADHDAAVQLVETPIPSVRHTCTLARLEGCRALHKTLLCLFVSSCETRKSWKGADLAPVGL